MGRREDALVRRIRELFADITSEVPIGDDAAVIQPPTPLVVTNDVLVENVDFTDAIPLSFVAEKSLASNLSDLAAMGARPTHFVLALAIPRSALESIDEFLSSLSAAAKRYDVTLVGGDLSAASELVISITAFGRLAGARPLVRSSARGGERIYVSRPLGGSSAGLTLLGKGWRIDRAGRATPPTAAAFGYAQVEFAAAALRHHVSPLPELALGAALAARPDIGACIDISDGLSTDLHRICEASGVGAEIEWERIPLFPDLHTVGRTVGVVTEEAVLHGGEEYALLFTSSARESELSARLGRPVYAIGRIVSGSGVTLVRDGISVPLGSYGYDHFA